MQRQNYLDWLRILAILGVLFFHSAMPFIEWGFHIRNKETSNMLLEMNDFLHMFRMPLLFFISGTVSYYMLRNRTGAGFIGLRFTRLFIPVVFGVLVIVPPQVYMERLTQGFKGNFWQFYPSVFKTGMYPHGNFSWHHLWFIVYLLIYDIICAPFFVWVMSGKAKGFVQRLGWLATGKRIYLLMLPAVLINAFMSYYFPETNALIDDPAYFLYWLSFLLPGFLCIANSRLMDSIENNRQTSFTIAFLSLMLLCYLRWNDLEPWDINILPYTYAFHGLRAICGWGWVMTLIGYGKKKLDKPHPALSYLNQAVYPFYILHQTVIIIVAYYVVQTPDTIGMKYAFIVITTLLISMCIYHLFIRPFSVTRFLFGMKPLPKQQIVKEPQPALQ